MTQLHALDNYEDDGSLDEGHEHDSPTHALLCPRCWELTGAWLGAHEATCMVCGGAFVVPRGDA